MPNAKKQSRTPESLESYIESLESIITRLEIQDQPLDESLLLFEDGIKHIRESQRLILEAEQRVTVLTEKNGTLESQVTTGIVNDSD